MPFRLPTRLWLVPGSLQHLPEVAVSYGHQRTLLVYDEGISHTPWPEQVTALLMKASLDVVPFSEIEPNPRHTTVDALSEMARAEKIQQVVGLGGGSVLDAAKAVAMLVSNPGSCVAYEGKERFSEPPAPFIAIPTTCGTGSEVTWVCVISHSDEARKMSIKGTGMFPNAALVDADLLQTLPAHLVAYTGMDALTHALEAYVCRVHNPVSDALAEKAITLLLRYLKRAVAQIAHDAEAREAVMRASTLAGMAFGNADVASVHCLSETLGGKWDLPHGLCNAILLVPVLRYQFDAITPRLAQLYHEVVNPYLQPEAAAAEAMLEVIETLAHALDLPSFSTFQIPQSAYASIAEGAVQNNSNVSSPQQMTSDDYLAILNLLLRRGTHP